MSNPMQITIKRNTSVRINKGNVSFIRPNGEVVHTNFSASLHILDEDGHTVDFATDEHTTYLDDSDAVPSGG